MAESKRRTSAQRPTPSQEAIAGTITEQVNAPPQQEEDTSNKIEYPCAVVMRVPRGNGKEEIQIIAYNGIDELSIPLLLRLAADIKENQIKGG